MEFELVTLDGTRIRWGKSPATNTSGKLSGEQKVQLLLRQFDQFGTLDTASGRLDIKSLNQPTISSTG